MRNNNKAANRCKTSEKLKSFDQFGQPFTIKLTKDGKTEVRSVLGASLSLFMIIMLLAYAGYKTKIFIERSTNTISEAVLRNHFSYEEKFTADHGLMVVAGTSSALPP